ncbi:hypothetical protein DFR30_1029 [Thiogranum longum]|uniref:Uncharacterized protein n=1 Tax=Thiogranum longum TaxID=1537524 RepID=A0A4R1H7I6_9GAMM|nr:hypothetical protein [Thiogranum longum]TCK17787.1 hypothetical protein DFR30_1029 [Thiogranum longum]
MNAVFFNTLLRRTVCYVLFIPCSLSVALPSVAETRATVLWYLEQEAGNEPWEVRYIITDHYLRSDQGDGSVDFVLLDRREKQIYNVVEDSRTILNIDGRGETGKRPEALDIEVKRSHDSDAPTLEGQDSTTLKLFADGELCYSSVVVEGLMDDSRDAFEAFADVLAVQQQRSKGNTPAEYITPCFQARYLYKADFDVALGLPVITWGPKGEHRQLLRYERDVVIDDALFELPKDYEQYQPLAP